MYLPCLPRLNIDLGEGRIKIYAQRGMICLYVCGGWGGWGGCMPYQQHFSYLTATVHKSMFPRVF